MKNAAALLMAGVAGAGIAAAVLWPRGGGDAPLTTSDGITAPAPAHAGDGDPQLARIEAAIAQLNTRVADLDRRLEAALERLTSHRTAPDAPPATLVFDESALQRAVENASEKKERTKYDGLTSEQLLAEARRLHLEAKDPLSARRALDLLLARSLDPLERAKALTELGILQRSGGELKASAATLQQVVDAHGLASEVGTQAGYQLIWSLWNQDPNAALKVADLVARDGTDAMRIHARWSAAMLAHELGDFGRARAGYTAILRDCADKPHLEGLANDVRKRLESLGTR